MQKINSKRHETLEFFTAQSGATSARVLGGNSVRHLHSAIDPQSEARYFPDLSFWGRTIVFLGTGLGYHVAEKIHSLPPESTLVLADSFPECLDHFQSHVLKDRGNAVIKVSPESLLDGRIDLAKLALKGTVQFIKHPASFHMNPGFFHEVRAALFLHREKTKRPAHRVLLLHGSFFLEEELRRAFEQNGTLIEVFRYPQYGFPHQFEAALDRGIQEFRPDLILSVNMMGFDGEGALPQNASAAGIPIAVWFVDDPYPILAHRRQWVNASMIAFSWERAYLPPLRNAGFGDVHYLPLAGDVEMMSSAEEKPDLDLAFVGSSMGRAFLQEKILSKFLWDPRLEPMVQKSLPRILAGNASIRQILLEAAAGNPLFPRDDMNLTWLCSYAIHSASCRKRRDLIQGLLTLGIQTFGDPQGWRDLIGPGLKTNPDIDYRTSLGRIYSRIAVNLNITSCQMKTAVNQRVFDVPLAGGFVLSDNQPDLSELFAMGSEAVSYESLDDCREKIAFYLKNPDARERISSAARRRIQAEHLYLHRAKVILESLL